MQVLSKLLMGPLCTEQPQGSAGLCVHVLSTRDLTSGIQPHLWNSIPREVRLAPAPSMSRGRLKIISFGIAVIILIHVYVSDTLICLLSLSLL